MNIYLPYYSEVEYKQLLTIARDKDTMYRMHGEWLEEVMRLKVYMESQNYVCRFITIEVEKMVKYFKENNLENVGASRSIYVQVLGENLHGEEEKE